MLEMSQDVIQRNRRKTTEFMGTSLPKDYLTLVENVFNKNFTQYLFTENKVKECFIADGALFPDELVLVISLKNPKNLRMTTCVASVDYPAAIFKSEAQSKASSTSETVELSVNQCVDAIASFFQTYFQENRPVDYDLEYRQNWTPVDLNKSTRVFLKINRDNLELEAQADEILKNASSKKKKQLH